MKRSHFYILLLALLAFFRTEAQYTGRKDVKIYGYSRITTPGTIPVDIDEQGNRLPRSKPVEPEPQYHIYMCGNAGIKVTELYIKGTRYSIQQEKVLNTPVYEERYDLPAEKEKKILVPKSTATTFFIAAVNAQSGQSAPKSIRPLTEKSELVIVYTLNNKQYTASLKKIIVLKPIAGY